MKDIDEIDKETAEKANVIIKGIQEELELAIKSLERNDYNGAVFHVEKGKELSNCPICQKDLGIAVADVVHTESICNLGSEFCDDEKDALIEKMLYLKDEFVPIATIKKITKDEQEGKGAIPMEERRLFAFPKINEIFPFLFTGEHDKY